MYQSPFLPNEIKYFMSLMMNEVSYQIQVRSITIKYKRC